MTANDILGMVIFVVLITAGTYIQLYTICSPNCHAELDSASINIIDPESSSG